MFGMQPYNEATDVRSENFYGNWMQWSVLGWSAVLVGIEFPVFQKLSVSLYDQKFWLSRLDRRGHFGDLWKIGVNFKMDFEEVACELDWTVNWLRVEFCGCMLELGGGHLGSLKEWNFMASCIIVSHSKWMLYHGVS